jgi:glutathione S-transferase
LNPGLHRLRVKPLTGLTTLPVLLPELADQPEAIADSTQIFHFLEHYHPEPSYILADSALQRQAAALEDWLDESIGVAARFVYYDFRAKEGKALDPSLASQLVIQTVRWQYGITPAAVALAQQRLQIALADLEQRWQQGEYLVGQQWSIADLAAAALLSPLMRIPDYRQTYGWLGDLITHVHHHCQEPLPPGLA